MSYTSAASTEIAKYASAAEYELFLRPQNACNILSSDAGADTFTIEGDFTAKFTDNAVIYVTDTSGNNGRYTVDGNSSLSGGNTVITVEEEIAAGSAGGWVWLRQEYVQGSLAILQDEDQAGSIRAAFPNTALAMSDETYPDSFTAIGCLVLAVSYVASERAIEMRAEILSVHPVDFTFAIVAGDPLYKLRRRLCVIGSSVGPKEVVVNTSTRRAIALLNGGVYGETYGLGSSGIGDLGFDAATGTIRRAWADQGTRIWKHATDDSFTNADGNLETYELAQEHYRFDYFSGAATIIEADPAATYYIENLGAFEETQLGDEGTTSGKNCDFARIFEAMLTYPDYRGGYGASLGGEWGSAITAVNTGAKRFTIAGDHTRYYKAGGRIYVQSSTANDGTYSIDSATLSSGNTLIVVNESVPDATADGFVTLDTGLDMPGLMPFDRGRNTRLLSDIADNFQRNVKLIFDPELAKWYVIAVTQKAAGSTDWTLYHAKSIDQSREGADVYTGVLLTGRKARPLNVVEKAVADGTLVDLKSAGDWAPWNGVTAESDVANLSDIEDHICDGNATLGVLLHNLNATADIDAGADQYTGWYTMFEFDIDPDRPVTRIEVTAPPTRQERAAGGHQDYYWPGLRLDIYSDELSAYYPCSPLLNGRFEPGSDITIEKTQIPRRYGSKMRLLGGAYDHGFDIQTDPSVGCAELRVYQDEDYEIAVSISPMHAITGVTTGASGSFEVAGDIRLEPTALKAADTFVVRGNAHAGTNTTWTVASISFAAGTSTIVVTGTINAGATVSGELYTSTDYVIEAEDDVQRDYPDLWDRFGGINWYEEDLGDRWDEPLARVFAIQSLSDFLKVHQQVTYRTTGADPRPRQWDTVNIVDELNGNITTLLARRVLKTETHTEVSGTNYLGGTLGE